MTIFISAIFPEVFVSALPYPPIRTLSRPAFCSFRSVAVASCECVSVNGGDLQGEVCRLRPSTIFALHANSNDRSSPQSVDSAESGIGSSSTPQMFECVSDGRGGGGEVCAALSRLESVELARLFLDAKKQSNSVTGEQMEEVSTTDVVCEGSYSNGNSVGAASSHSPPDAMLTQELDTIAVQLRERDESLALAARVGQELLEQNAMLTSNLHAAASSSDDLEREMSHLRHQLAVKERMMQLYAQEAEEAAQARSISPPPRSVSSASSGLLSEETTALLAEECLELRDANRLLAEEVTLLRDQAVVLERRESELIADCVVRLNDAATQIAELQRGTVERDQLSAQHAHEIARLRTSNSRTELAHRQLELEKADLQESLEETNTRHSQLASMVGELQDHYKECVDLFRQAQEELAFYRRHATVPYHASGFRTPEEGDRSPLLSHRPMSVSAELEAALKQLNVSPSSTSSTADNSVERLPIPCKLHTNGTKGVDEGDMSPMASPPRSVHQTVPHSSLGLSSVTLPGHTSHSEEVRHAMEAVRMFSNQSASRASTPVSSPTLRRRVAHTLPLHMSPASGGGLNSLSVSKSIDHQQPVKQAQSASQKPRKVCIFKPMEGSLTLLRWKLLALEQQSGSQTLQQALSKPGVYVKNGGDQAEDGVKKVHSTESVAGKETPTSSDSLSSNKLQRPVHMESDRAASPDLERTPSPEPMVVADRKTTPPIGGPGLFGPRRIFTKGGNLGGMPFGLSGSPGLGALTKQR